MIEDNRESTCRSTEVFEVITNQGLEVVSSDCMRGLTWEGREREGGYLL